MLDDNCVKELWLLKMEDAEGEFLKEETDVLELWDS